MAGFNFYSSYLCRTPPNMKVQTTPHKIENNDKKWISHISIKRDLKSD
jgi:hypothetical protein